MKKPRPGIPQPILRDWNNQPIPVPSVQKVEGNPCIALYGIGPVGAICAECTHLIGICHARTYYKCRLRKNTNGPKTDHCMTWCACAKFERRDEGKDIPLYDGR